MFRTCSADYIHIPAGEYRSVETNVSHHPRHTVGMRRLGPWGAFGMQGINELLLRKCWWRIRIFRDTQPFG